MKILKRIIEKKIENESFLVKCNQDDLAYQEHISAYLLCLFYLNKLDTSLKEKKKIWKRYINTQNKRFLLQLGSYRGNEDNIIMSALKKMDLQAQQETERWGALFGDFVWAILSFEHEENE